MKTIEDRIKAVWWLSARCDANTGRWRKSIFGTDVYSAELAPSALDDFTKHFSGTGFEVHWVPGGWTARVSLSFETDEMLGSELRDVYSMLNGSEAL